MFLIKKAELIMSENTNPTQNNLELKQKWLTLLQKLIPLADSLSRKLLTYAIFATLITVWLGLFCYRLNGLSIIYSAIISTISFIPALILYVYYFKLQEVSELAQNLHDFSHNTELSSDSFLAEVKKIKEIKLEQINTFNLIQQGKRIYEFVNVINSAKGLLSQYVSIGFLINPLTLLFLTGALAGLFFLSLMFFITLVMAII